jgi:hypothetical protein
VTWAESYRADPIGVPIADRHYNRQSVGSPQFVPPGRCVVLLAHAALWVTSWPKAEYVKHAWAGAWVNSTFRKEERDSRASEMITEAVAATLWYWPEPPALGIVSFVDPREVPPVRRRGRVIYGYCYLMAGWEHVGFTKAGLWTWQLLPAQMPPAEMPRGVTRELPLEVA